jgi:23S rRNA (cytosine1962-C5)-methyltransferase
MTHPPFAAALDALPAPAEKPVVLRVTGSAESRLRAGHPWLAVEQIRSESRAGQPGDRGVVFDRKRNFLAVGLYDPCSPLRLRVLRARQPGPVDEALMEERVAAALARRASLPATDTDAYRMIHGESDGLPGLVADRYADTAVVKLYSHAWMPWLRPVLEALMRHQPVARVVLRLSRQLSAAPERLAGLYDGQLLLGELPDETLTYKEHGLRYEVDPVRGQKTGSFLDQRDNRAQVGRLSEGRRVLNVFSYTGGFSLAAARGGATEVWSVDLSGPALAASERNFALNLDLPAVAAATHVTREGDAFAVMKELARAGERFDLVIVDPPAFARRNAQVAGALEAYGRLAELAVTLLEPGGTVVLASCSKPVSAEAFVTCVGKAAAAAGRPLRELEQTGHALDHPTDFAESAYLKGVFATA